jgi:hypothetical protein
VSIFLLNLATALILSIIKVVCLLVAIAYFTLAERKIMAAVQRRVGPNVVGPFGLLQPLADGLKLAGKELAIPAQASSRIFLTVSMTVLLFALSGWATIPFGLFDHSEYMSTNTITKILLLGDDQLSPDGHFNADYRAYPIEFETRHEFPRKWNWQAELKEYIEVALHPVSPEVRAMVSRW